MKTILFIDDDPVVTALYRNCLKNEGFDIQIAADGAEAAEKLRQRCPDLAILDLNMPGVSGVDVLRVIRTTPQLKHLPVIVFSSGYMLPLVKEAEQLGIHCMLTKSACPPKKLIAQVNDLMSRTTIPASALASVEAVADRSAAGMRGLFDQFAAAADSSGRHRILLIIYKSTMESLQEALMTDEETPRGRLSRALDAMFKDLYSHPDHITASAQQTLIRGLSRLIQLEEEARPVLESELALKDLLRSLDD